LDSGAGEHMFVVPACGRPAWIERCLDSLERQTQPSAVLITTSTPNGYLSDIARRRGVALEVNPSAAGIASDWNFALSRATRPWVTLAHQDDWYAPDYVESCLEAAARSGQPLIVFTRAAEEFRNRRRWSPNTLIKQLMCDAVFLGRTAVHTPSQKLLLLRFGDPIPCSTVMINRLRVPDFAFAEGWRCSLDWWAWLALARRPGAFAYVRRPLVHRTVHADAATVAWLDQRAVEDERILRELWPRPLASALGALYSLGRRHYEQFGDVREVDAP
jgi:glycosyl transferase family 2